MASYSIGEVAERTGFSASALRYYEGIGLVVPTGRTAVGYRVYDDTTVDRLAFIARAKQLGCTLDEVTDLVGIWDGEACGPVQRRFHELVTAKLASTRSRVSELETFAAQLRVAADRLDEAPVDGPCSSACACLGCDDLVEPVPIACSLAPEAATSRLDEWAAVLADARRTDLAEGLHLDLGPDVDLVGLARLVAAEHACCPFFAFRLTVDRSGVALEVRAPADAQPFISAIFGAPVGPHL